MQNTTWKKLKYLLLGLLLIVSGSSLVLLLAEDNNLPANGSLIKTSTSPQIYYVGVDNRKYPFPNEATYFSWYHNFSLVQTVDQTTIESLVTGPNITIRPGIRFIKFTDSARVYAVEPGSILRWIPNENMFQRLGYTFSQLVELPNSLINDYVMGTELTGPANGSVIRQGPTGSLFFVKNNQLLPTTLLGMERNRFFPHHIRTTDLSLTENMTRGSVTTRFDPAIHLRPDERWNTIDPNEEEIDENQEIEENQNNETGNGTDPTNFVAQGGVGYVSLAWQLSTNTEVTGYILYRSSQPITTVDNNLLITTVANNINTYLDSSNIGEGAVYYYGIRSVLNNGNFGTLITAQAITLSGTNEEGETTPAPNPPTNFSASANQQGVHLSWTAPTNVAINNYQVYRSLSTITNVGGNGVSLITTINIPTTQYLDTNVNSNTTYHYAVRAVGSSGISSHVTAQATTPSPPLDRILALPEPPDNYVNPDALTWSKNAVTLAASLGINKIMMQTRYYQGANDLAPDYGPAACVNHVGRFCGDYHNFLSHVDALTTPDGRPVEVIMLAAKVTKTPMTGDPQQKGAIKLQQMGVEPYDFLANLSQTSGTLPPSGQGENRAFVTINFSTAAERDRLLRITSTVSGNSVRIRWYPSSWETASFFDTGVGSQALGTHSWDFPNPTVGGNNQYLIMIQNTGSTPLTWSITGLEEVAPVPSTIRNQDSTHYEWLGNSNAFTTYGYNHPRYALNETRTRFIDTMQMVWNEFSDHSSLIGLMGNGDEPHSMFWMDEDISAFQNAGHELAEFEKAVAAGQYSYTQNNFLLFGDPRDPTHGGISTGVYASNMAGGGFADMASRFNGSEKINWILWAGDHSTNQISGFTSQGFGVYLMQALYESDYVSGFTNWANAASGLSASQKQNVKGWYYYTESRSSVTQSILQEVVNATPDNIN